MKTEFIIVRDFSAWGITKKINKLLAEGWVLQGGICKAWGNFFQ